MSRSALLPPTETDCNQKYSEICELSEEGTVLCRRQIPTTEAGLRKLFGRRDPRHIVLETGGLTPWDEEGMCSRG